MIAVIFEICFFIILSLSFLDKNKEMDCNFLSFDKTDFLRGIAILMIIVMHSCANLKDASGFSSLGGIGVSLFLILSAYGLNESWKKNGLKEFWSKKIRRIWIPYGVFLLIITSATLQWNRFLSFKFYLDLLCINSSYWFISFLVYNYVLFWISKRFKLGYWTFVIFGLILFVFSDRLRAEQIFSFPIGIFLSTRKDMIVTYYHNNLRRYLLFICGALCVSFILFALSRVLSFGNNVLVNFLNLYKFVIAVCIALIYSILPPPPHTLSNTLQHGHCPKYKYALHPSKFLVFCSTISLELYLVHFSLYTKVLDGEKPIVSMTTYLILTFVGAIVLNMITNTINKLKCLKK